jgi:hypothetical protein
MIYFLALIPATGLTVAGYLVHYLSNRSEGAFRTFGKYLGFWAFTLAALVVLAAIFAAAHGGHRGGMMMHGGMHGSWPRESRFNGPHEEEPREHGEANPQGPNSSPNPAPPPGPPPSTH